jgi:ornithine cyclodeaminase/alanine dehydrogenase-like protein (mu-crystallin family)
VRSIERVKVYSVTKEHRDRFAEEMTELLNVEVQPVSDTEAVVRGSDIVMCATNSSEPVFDGNRLEAGQLVTTIANTDGVHQRTEADAATMVRADFIMLNNKETAITNQQRELLDLVEGGTFGWEKVCELGQVLTGDHPGRKNDRQIVYYKSNTGVGIQFAAAGALIYEECKKRGVGRELPGEWFGADLSEWMDKGFMRSP